MTCFYDHCLHPGEEILEGIERFDVPFGIREQYHEDCYEDMFTQKLLEKGWREPA